MNFKINSDVFANFPQLESERLLFWNFKISDAGNLYEMRSNKDVMKYLDRPFMKSIEEARDMINNMHESFKNHEGINWAIIEKETNVFMGYIGFWRMDKENCRAEVGYTLLPQFWGQDFMTEALQEVVNFGFNDLNLHSIEANCNPENIISMKLLEKIGFKKEAYFRENYLFENKFLDSIIYCLLQKDLQ